MIGATLSDQVIEFKILYVVDKSRFHKHSPTDQICGSSVDDFKFAGILFQRYFALCLKKKTVKILNQTN